MEYIGVRFKVSFRERRRLCLPPYRTAAFLTRSLTQASAVTHTLQASNRCQGVAAYPLPQIKKREALSFALPRGRRGSRFLRKPAPMRAQQPAAAARRAQQLTSAPISDNARIRLNESIHIIFLFSFIIKRHPLTRFSFRTHFFALPYAYQ